MTAAYQPNAYQPDAYQIGVAQPAFQANAFQFGAFQEEELTGIPAFQPCVFQFDAFQTDVCPIPPEPIDNDSHDGGRKKRLKKLRELEEKRIAIKRQQDEDRKMAIRFAIDPQAKAEYEAKMLALEGKVPDLDTKAAERDAKQREIDKIDVQIARIEKMQQSAAVKQAIQQELGRIATERQIRQAQIDKEIRDADDEMALMMLM